jgi:hypothetical protein
MQLTYSPRVIEELLTSTEFFRNLADETKDGFFIFDLYPCE